LGARRSVLHLAGPPPQQPGVAVRWVEGPEGFQDAAAIVLPGTRDTIADLRWLWETGLGAAVRTRAGAGLPVVGLCGGYQMLGREVSDPLGVEAGGSTPGLGLLDLRTALAGSKHTHLTSVRFVAPEGVFAALRGHEIAGYEIHHGETSIGASTQVWFESARGPLGAGRGSVWGTYLHGFFADDLARRVWVSALHGECTMPAWEARVDAGIDRIADAVAAAVDIDAVTQLIENGVPCG